MKKVNKLIERALLTEGLDNISAAQLKQIASSRNPWELQERLEKIDKNHKLIIAISQALDTCSGTEWL